MVRKNYGNTMIYGKINGSNNRSEEIYMAATNYYELIKLYASLWKAGVLGFFLDNSGQELTNSEYR